jgi:hypothetical protein
MSAIGTTRKERSLPAWSVVSTRAGPAMPRLRVIYDTTNNHSLVSLERRSKRCFAVEIDNEAGSKKSPRAIPPISV